MTDHLTGDQYADFIKEARANENVRGEVRFETLAETFNAILKDADDDRLFAGEYIFALFDAYRSLIILAASLLHTNFESGSGKQWHEDHRLDCLLKSFMTDDEFREFSSQPFKLEWARKSIERKMIEQIGKIISGQESADQTLSEAKRIQAAALKAQVDAEQVS